MNKSSIQYIIHPTRLLVRLDQKGLLRLSDATYLGWLFKQRLGYKLNLNNPVTFNAKMQWLKLYDRNPIYTTMVDKYAVKDYVGKKIGYQYIIPTLGVWDRYDDIDFNSLPERFVLKCTHDSGGLVIVRDKEKLDHKRAKEKIERSLKRNYYYLGREWPYKDVEPRILAEEYVEDTTSIELNVYKLFCFAGKSELIQTIQGDKTAHETIDYFDVNWNLMDLKQNFPNSRIHLNPPKGLKEMLELAKQLSEGHPFIRVDFYSVDSKVYFSEFTFYSDSGLAEFNPESWDKKLGDLIVLPLDMGGGRNQNR